jgi:prepilin-type N-terminal cleavage/methylation domain-containing protein
MPPTTQASPTRTLTHATTLLYISPMHSSSSRTLAQRAFSLVELSIVLVILGLLIGGILSGQSLIRAAELRGVSTDLQRFNTAIYTFRDKYFALPGDMTNAQSFWNVRAVGSNLVCQQTINVTTGTCNSDGNGQINYVSGDTAYHERFLSWQHLAYAGLIEGSYTGASANATVQQYAAGINMPRGRISNSAYLLTYLAGPVSGNIEWFDGAYSVNQIYMDGKIKPEEMWNIDVKLDDGKPATGIIYATKTTGTWSPGCATSDLVSAEYALSSNSNLCLVWMSLR